MMTKHTWLFAITLLVSAAPTVSIPSSRKEDVTETIHGVVVHDSYRWLEDQNSPETRGWIARQNAYTESILRTLPGRDRIHKRMEELLRIDQISMPVNRGGRYFFRRRQANQNQFAIYMRNGLEGKDVMLVDPNQGDQTTSANILDVSKDGKWLVYGTRQGGEDEVAITLMDVDTRKPLSDSFPRARYAAVSLTPDKTVMYYSLRKETGSRVYYHRIGTEVAKDREIFGKGTGPSQFVLATVSEDGRYLALYISHGWGKKTEVYVQNLETQGPIATVVNDIDADFFGEIAGDQLFLATNWKAPNSRILAVDLKNPERKNWREIVPEASSVLESFSAAGGKLAVKYLENVNSKIKIFEPSGTHVRDIVFPTLGAVTELRGQWDKDETFYGFHSFAQPLTIYRYQMSRGQQTVWARLDVPIDSSQFTVKQVWYESKDGTKIPMFLIHKKGLEMDGNRPTLLYGYGGFLVNLTPSFRTDAAFWAENGGVFAVANLRGGGEFGEKWHQAGMMEKKQNVFDDFIGAAEWLTKNGYTRPSRLAIMGGSNGGLLVGAAMTQRPDLFRAVVCDYPLLDMVRYHRFLVAKLWVPEYGSADDAKQFAYLYRYSPYHQVKDGVKYPAVLFVTGDSDTRVAPLHARKMAARMQAATTSDRPILLHYDTKAGHSGGQPVSKQIDDETDIMSFLWWQLGA